MPVSKKKPTTSTSEGSTQQSPSPALPEQEEFRQYLRRLAVSAVQVLIEQVMREELEQCIGASWGEITPLQQCSATDRSDRCLYHGDQLPYDCLGHNARYPFAQNSRLVTAEVEREMEEQATSFPYWFRGSFCVLGI